MKNIYLISTDNDIESYIKKDNYFLVTIDQIGIPAKKMK